MNKENVEIEVSSFLQPLPPPSSSSHTLIDYSKAQLGSPSCDASTLHHLTPSQPYPQNKACLSPPSSSGAHSGAICSRSTQQRPTIHVPCQCGCCCNILRSNAACHSPGTQPTHALLSMDCLLPTMRQTLTRVPPGAPVAPLQCSQ